MSKIHQPKVSMHAVQSLADSGASQGARRATEDAPESAPPPVAPAINSEVVQKWSRKFEQFFKLNRDLLKSYSSGNFQRPSSNTSSNKVNMIDQWKKQVRAKRIRLARLPFKQATLGRSANGIRKS